MTIVAGDQLSWLERQICILEVKGSTPLSSTILEIIEGRLSNKKEIISGNSSAVYKSLNKRRSTNLIIGLNELIFVIKRKFIDKLGSWITRETTCYPEMDNVEVEEN